MLSETQIERYSRQIILPQIGGRGQEMLLSTTVTVCGSGELAMTAALYLAAAGVGHLSVAAPIAAAIDGLNPDCRVTLLALDYTSDAATAAVYGAAAVLCADANPATCALMNVASMAVHVPLLVGEAVEVTGWMSACAGFDPDAPCYACLPRPIENIRPLDGTALGGVAAGVIGSLLATEAIKLVLHLGASPIGRRLSYDALASEVREERLRKDAQCPACGANA